MDTQHIQAVIVLAEHLHFANASRELGISQPALSQKIQRIEAEVGTALFVRTPRQVVLTDAGRAFLDSAQDVVRQFEAMIDHTRSVARGEVGRIRIGFVENASYHVVPRATVRLRRKHPSVKFELHEMISAELINALARRTIDVAILRPIVGIETLTSQVVLTEPYNVALAENNPLARQDSVSLRELGPLPFIVASGQKAQYIKAQFRPALARYGFSLRTGQEVSQLPAIIALVATGFGYTLLPRSATGLMIPGVVYRPLADKDAPQAELVVAWREEDKSPLVASFVYACRELRSELSWGRSSS